MCFLNDQKARIIKLPTMQIFGFSPGSFLIISVFVLFIIDLQAIGSILRRALGIRHSLRSFLEGMFISNTNRRLGALG